jgi:hypothetical protein
MPVTFELRVDVVVGGMPFVAAFNERQRQGS